MIIGTTSAYVDPWFDDAAGYGDTAGSHTDELSEVNVLSASLTARVHM
jgi:hypothetical protein